MADNRILIAYIDKQAIKKRGAGSHRRYRGFIDERRGIGRIA